MGRLSLISIRMFAPFIGFQEGKKNRLRNLALLIASN